MLIQIGLDYMHARANRSALEAYRARIGVCRVVIARGRDASDVAITTVFGNHQLVNFSVTTEEVFDVNA